jgi:hypothetical protein
MGNSKSKQMRRFQAISLYREMQSYYQYRKMILTREGGEELEQNEIAMTEIKVLFLKSQSDETEENNKEGYRAMKKHYENLKSDAAYQRYKNACLSWAY